MALDAVAPAPSVGRAAAVVGATLWLTGLPSAGKTTIALALAQSLRQQAIPVEVLDGDVVRPVLSPELGYSRADRDANVARIGWVAELLARNGVLVIASVVSPFAQARDGVRQRHVSAAVPFFEIHVATPIAVCADRDVKGLYAKQRDGQLDGLTGTGGPGGEYESPTCPELRIDTSERTVDDVVDELIALLRKENLV
jgi:adenylylsulfate kinase